MQRYTELVIEEWNHVFKLAELHAAYEMCIEQLNRYLNNTHLKGELLDYFQKYGIQEQSDGKYMLFYFSLRGYKNI